MKYGDGGRLIAETDADRATHAWQQQEFSDAWNEFWLLAFYDPMRRLLKTAAWMLQSDQWHPWLPSDGVIYNSGAGYRVRPCELGEEPTVLSRGSVIERRFSVKGRWQMRLILCGCEAARARGSVPPYMRGMMIDPDGTRSIFDDVDE